MIKFQIKTVTRKIDEMLLSGRPGSLLGILCLALALIGPAFSCPAPAAAEQIDFRITASRQDQTVDFIRANQGLVKVYQDKGQGWELVEETAFDQCRINFSLPQGVVSRFSLESTDLYDADTLRTFQADFVNGFLTIRDMTSSADWVYYARNLDGSYRIEYLDRRWYLSDQADPNGPFMGPTCVPLGAWSALAEQNLTMATTVGAATNFSPFPPGKAQLEGVPVDSAFIDDKWQNRTAASGKLTDSFFWAYGREDSGAETPTLSVVVRDAAGQTIDSFEATVGGSGALDSGATWTGTRESWDRYYYFGLTVVWPAGYWDQVCAAGEYQIEFRFHDSTGLKSNGRYKTMACPAG